MSSENNRRPLLLSLGFLPNKFRSLTALKTALDCVLMFLLLYWPRGSQNMDLCSHFSPALLPLNQAGTQTSTQQENAFKPCWCPWDQCHRKSLFSVQNTISWLLRLAFFYLLFCFASPHPQNIAALLSLLMEIKRYYFLKSPLWQLLPSYEIFYESDVKYWIFWFGLSCWWWFFS